MRYLITETRTLEYVIEAPASVTANDLVGWVEDCDSDCLFCNPIGSDLYGVQVQELDDESADAADYADLNVDLVIDEDMEIIEGENVPVFMLKGEGDDEN